MNSLLLVIANSSVPTPWYVHLSLVIFVIFLCIFYLVVFYEIDIEDIKKLSLFISKKREVIVPVFMASGLIFSILFFIFGLGNLSSFFFAMFIFPACVGLGYYIAEEVALYTWEKDPWYSRYGLTVLFTVSFFISFASITKALGMDVKPDLFLLAGCIMVMRLPFTVGKYIGSKFYQQIHYGTP